MDSHRRRFLLGATVVAGAAALRGASLPDGFSATSLSGGSSAAKQGWTLGLRLPDGRLVPNRRHLADLSVGEVAEVRLAGLENGEGLPPAVRGFALEVDTGAEVSFTAASVGRLAGANVPTRFVVPAGGFALIVKTRWEGGGESVDRFTIDKLARGGWVLAWLPEGDERFEGSPHLAFDVEPLEAGSRSFV